jgi:hypothetical protein
MRAKRLKSRNDSIIPAEKDCPKNILFYTLNHKNEGKEVVIILRRKMSEEQVSQMRET